MAHLNTNPTHAHNHITRAAAAMVSWFTMFREEARWVLAGFYASPLSWSNWNLECWFLWWEKNPHAGWVQQETQPTYDTGSDSNPGASTRTTARPCCCKYSDYLMPSSDFLIQIKKLEIQEKENS